MQLFQRLILAATLIMSLSAHAEKITIAAASDLKFVMDEIIANFKQEHPKDEIEVIYGSSGKFHTQIQQGAPYDVFFSADIEYPRLLAKADLAASEVVPYAVGRIVLWSTTQDASKMTLANLTDPAIKHIAIADPKHAPYGKRAEEALRAQGLWEKVENKLVYGDTILAAAQFVQSGNAQVGIIALALALNPELSGKGSYWLIPEELHTPLEQGFIITKRADKNLLAKQFATYFNSKPAGELMSRYGFVLPKAVK